MRQLRIVLMMIGLVVAAHLIAASEVGLRSALIGKTWLARSFGEEPATPGVHSTLSFASDGTLSGSGGCNRLNGAWELDDDELTVGPFAATMMMCLGDRMDQESTFLSAIQHGVRVEASGEGILLHPKGGGEPIRMVESNPAKLRGVVSYRERMALPRDAIITVRLLDVSKQDAPASVLANQMISPETQVPVPFTLDYESAEIDERMTYAIDAEIRVGDRLLFRSAEQHPVLTRGAPKDEVEIELERVK